MLKSNLVSQKYPEWLDVENGCVSSQACEQCGIKNLAYVKTWSIPHFTSQDNQANCLKPYILVVGSSPTREEDENGSYNKFNPRSHWHLPCWFLDKLDCRYAATTAVTCYPGEDGDNGNVLLKANKKQGSLCASQNITWLIEKYQIKVVVCLGKQAMEAVLGKNSPKSVSTYGTTPTRICEGSEVFVLTLQHPSAHRPNAKTNPKDLKGHYAEGFNVAEKIALKGINAPEIDWFEVSKVKDALLIAKEMPKEFSFDVEDNHWSTNPERASIYHRGVNGVELLCNGLSYEYKGKLRQPILVDAACRDLDVLKAIFTGRHASGYNILYDTTALRAILGFNAFEYVEDRYIVDEFGKRHLVPGIYDPFSCIYLGNQGLTGNNIGRITVLRWGIENWKLTAKRYLQIANEKIAQNRKEYGTLSKKILSYSKHSENLQSDDKKKVSAAKKWFKDNPDVPTLEHLPVLRPKGSADFGDIPADILRWYNAQDVYHEHQIRRILLPERLQDPETAWSPLAETLMMRIIEVCNECTHNGMSINQEMLKAASDRVDKIVKIGAASLLQSEYIQDCILKSKKWQKAILRKDFKLTKENVLQFVSVHVPAFKVDLAKVTGHEKELPATKGTRKKPRHEQTLSCGKPVFNLFCGTFNDAQERAIKSDDPAHWNKEWQRLTKEERLWYAVRGFLNTKNLKTKFLNPLSQFSVNDVVHTNFQIARIDSEGGVEASESTGGARTGRIQTSDPSLSNLSKDKNLRILFEAPVGWSWIESDYSSIEPVILAQLRGVKGWLKCFDRPDPLDVYRVMANEALQLGVDIDKEKHPDKALEEAVSKKIRTSMKTLTLAIMYGQSVKSFGEQAGLSPKKAKEFYEGYNEHYPQILEYREEIKKKIEREEFIITPFGRKTKYKMPYRDDKFEYNFARLLRQAINFTIQATGSDITCWKAWELHRLIKKLGLENDVKICMLLHDAIYLRVKDELVYPVSSLVVQHKEDLSTLPFKMNNLLRSAPSYGKNLGAMTEIITGKSPEMTREELFKYDVRNLVTV